MTEALEGSAARPGCALTPGKTRYPFYRRLGGPQGWSGLAENLFPTGIRARTVQPVVSRYTDWTTRPTNYIYIFKHTHTHTICACIHFIYIIYIYIYTLCVLNKRLGCFKYCAVLNCRVCVDVLLLRWDTVVFLTNLIALFLLQTHEVSETGTVFIIR